MYCPTGGLCDVSSYVSCVEQFLMPPPNTSTGPHSRVHPRLAWKSSEQSFCLIFPSAGIMGWNFRNTVSYSSLFSFSKVSEQHSPPRSVFSLRDQGLLHFHFSFLGISGIYCRVDSESGRDQHACLPRKNRHAILL